MTNKIGVIESMYEFMAFTTKQVNQKADSYEQITFESHTSNQRRLKLFDY